MKIKSIFAGLVAFLSAGVFVYAFEGNLRASNAAYIDPNSNQCIAWDASGCQSVTPEPCLEDVDDVGSDILMLQNLGSGTKGQPTDCGLPLFRTIR